MGKGKSIFGEYEGKEAHCNEILLIPSVDQKMARKNLKGLRGDEGEPLHGGKRSAPRGLDLPYRDQLVLFIRPQTLIGS